MGGLWFARLSQDDVVSPPFVPPTDLSELDFHHCPGLAGSSGPPRSTYYQNSQDLRSSEAPSMEPVVDRYLRRHYQQRRTLSPLTYEKVCKRRGIRKPVDECHRGREYQRSLLIKSDRDASHHGHRRSKAKRGPASLPGANLVGGHIDDRLHAYALPNDDQPNINQQNSLKSDQLNAQSLIRSKTPYDDDPYDAQDSALPSPLSSSDSQSDTEVGQNEKMVWMVMPNGFPGVAPPTRETATPTHKGIETHAPSIRRERWLVFNGKGDSCFIQRYHLKLFLLPSRQVFFPLKKKSPLSFFFFMASQEMVRNLETRKGWILCVLVLYIPVAPHPWRFIIHG